MNLLYIDWKQERKETDEMEERGREERMVNSIQRGRRKGGADNRDEEYGGQEKSNGNEWRDKEEIEGHRRGLGG